MAAIIATTGVAGVKRKTGRAIGEDPLIDSAGTAWERIHPRSAAKPS
jgi:hypothetical protein